MKTTTQPNSRFRRGSAAYRCDVCHKLTRETGEGESGCNLCLRCYTIAGLENELSDGHIDQAEFDRRVAQVQP